MYYPTLQNLPAPIRPGPHLARRVGLSNRGLLQSMPTLQIPQYTLCAVINGAQAIYLGMDNLLCSSDPNLSDGARSPQRADFF